MRPLLVILIWAGILGGLWGYTSMRDSWRDDAQPPLEIQPAPGLYSIRVTPTFDLVGGTNAFSIETGPDGQFQPTEHSPLVVWLNGQEIARREEIAFAGKSIDVHWNTDDSPVKVEMQKNEIRVSAFSPSLDPDASQGMRIEVLRDGETIDDQTLWAPPGEPLDDVVRVYIDQSHSHEQELH